MKITRDQYEKALKAIGLYEAQNPEAFDEKEIARKCFEFGTVEIVSVEQIRKSNHARITKVKHAFEGRTLIREIEYLNSTESKSVFAIKNERRELV